MNDIAIALVRQATLPLLDRALRSLSENLGDLHRASPSALAKAVCGPDAWCIAFLAVQADQPVGAVLATPIFSTTRGGAGLFVTDIWVAKQTRGNGLARRLLAASLKAAARMDAAHFVKLAVYDDNPEAHAAYARMGFVAQTSETNMILTDQALETLKGKT